MPTNTRKTATVKLPADLVQKAKIVVAVREPETTLFDYLAEIVRPIVERDLAKVVRRLIRKKQKNKDEWKAILPLKGTVDKGRSGGKPGEPLKK
jgi:hypothetical protein